MTPDRISGIDLSRRYYEDAVREIVLDVAGPGHSAALLDGGSEVLGFDDETSRDHGWGPRLRLFLPEDASRELESELDGALRERLPAEFLGYSTHFPETDDGGSRLMAKSDGGPIDHYNEISTVSRFLSGFLRLSSVDDLSEADWLSLPSQKLLNLSTGPVFYDRVGLSSLQERLRFYPDNVWMYTMAAQWMRLDQEAPFIGRTGLVGDEIGSRLIAARLVQHAMRLAFLIERRYPPYSKWFGTAFGKLPCADRLAPLIEDTLAASNWREREAGFVRLAGRLGELHNELGLTEHVDPSPRRFHDRPIQVVDCAGFASALESASSKSGASGLWASRPIGGIDTFSDSTDLLSDTGRRSTIAGLFD